MSSGERRSESSTSAVDFHPFTFDLGTLVLRRRGKLVKLGPQPRKLLRLLVERRPEPVTHDEIRRLLWSDNPNVDAEAGIYACVARLRAALKDPGGEQEYIQRVSGETSAYCFVGDVVARASEAPSPSIESVELPRLEDPPRAADSPGVPRASMGRVASGLVILVVMTATAIWIGSRNARPQRPVTYTMLRLEDGLNVGAPALALSPDGRRLAYTTGLGDLYVRDLGEPTSRKIAGAVSARMPFFSADGRWVGFREGDRLMKAASTGSAAVELTPDRGFGLGASWSVTGEVFVARNSRGLWRAAEGETPGLLLAPDAKRGERTYKFPEVLPGGKALLFTVGTIEMTTWDDGRIVAMPLEGGATRLIVEGGSCARYSPSGHVVYAREGALYAVPFDIESLEATGAPVRVVDDVMTNPVTGTAAFDISDDGTLVYAAGGTLAWNGRVMHVTRDGEMRAVTEDLGQAISAQPSPDGRRLLVDVTGATEQLWMYERDRGIFTRLTFAWDNLWSIWSPDGGSVVFWSSRPEPGLYWGSIGSLSDADLLVPSIHATATSFAPDGRNLVYDDSATGWDRDLWLVALDGDKSRTPFLATSSDEREAEFSPDGRFLAYTSDETGRVEIYVRAVDDPARKWQVSAEGGVRPRWAADGSELFFVTESHMMSASVRLAGGLELGQPEALFRLSENLIASNYTMAPDGRSFYIVQRTEAPPWPSEVHVVLSWAQELRRLAPES